VVEAGATPVNFSSGIAGGGGGGTGSYPGGPGGGGRWRSFTNTCYNTEQLIQVVEVEVEQVTLVLVIVQLAVQES
jgi:hypothetical protein